MHNKEILAVLLCTVALPFGNAWGQNNENQSPNDQQYSLETIVVHAQRREEAIINVPISLRALSGDELRKRETDDTEESLKGVANASITRRLNTGSAWNIAIRGISDAAGLNVDSSVAVYIDDVFIADSSGFNFEFFDMAALEVLRGPQGTLYGRNALGGALNIRLNAPEDDFGGQATLLYGSNNEIRTGGAINLPSEDGKFRTRITALYARHDGRIENRFPNAEDVDSLDAYGVRVKSEYDATENTLLRFGVDFANTERLLSLGERGTVFEQGVNSFQPTDSRLKNGGANIAIISDFDSLIFKSISAFRQTEGDSVGARPETILRDLSDYDIAQTTWTQEFQIRSNENDVFNWNLGVFGMIGENERESSLDNLDFNVAEISISEQRTKSFAVYGEGRYELTDKVALAMGGRYSFDNKRMDYRHVGDLTPALGGSFAPEQVINIERDYSDFTPQARLEYRHSENLMTYVKASKGYKAGGFNSEFVTANKVDFEKETLWNYEAGLKAGILDGAGFINFAIFHVDWNDQQALIFENFQSFVASAGKSRVRGAELEVFVEPGNGISVSGGVGYSDAIFEVFENADLLGNNANGRRQPRIPEWTGFFSFEQEFPLANDTDGFYRINYSYRSDFYWDNLATLNEDDRHLLDLSVGFRIDEVEAIFFVKNILNDEYVLQAFEAVPGFFPAQEALGQKRTWGARLNYAF